VDRELIFSRLTGRQVLGPGVFWSTLAYGLFAHAIGSSDLPSGHIQARILSVVLAHLAMIATLALTRLGTFRLKPTRLSLALVIMGYILAGAVRGAVLQDALFRLGAAGTAYSSYRLIGGVVVMTTGLIWAALAFGLKTAWGAKRSTLRNTKKRLEAILEASETRLELEASDTLSTIESMLQTALIPELAVSPQIVLTRLQALINDTLRPLSESLSASRPRLELVRLGATSDKFRWSTVLSHLRLRDSSRPFTISTILSVLAVNGFVKYVPEVGVLPMLCLSILSIGSTLAIARYFIARLVDQLPAGVRVPAVFLSLFASGFGGGLAVLSLANNPAVAYPLSVNAGVAAALIGSLFGINRAANVEINSIETQLSNYEYQLRWTIAALNAQHWLQKKQFARKLHGPIQSEVAAAAIRIERSLSTGEVTESGEQALQSLKDRLAKILNDTRNTSDVRPVLAEISETWHGLCDIYVDLSRELETLLKQDPVCVETVLEITREACSNAIRHGSANEIHLGFSREGDDLIRVEVANNGSKNSTSNRRGMGSAYLEDCTFNHDLVTGESGTVLTATVPIQLT
jgi:signal transduction histidine kinase